MDALSGLTSQLREAQDLAPAQAAAAAAALASAAVPDGPKEEFLTALARKGETADEVAAFAAAFRKLAVDPGVQAWAPRAFDIVGTGGDHAGGFNISTMVVLIVACAGIPVMKHGNRAITSRTGSADMFAAFGVKLDAPPELAQAALRELGFTFFFAPSYHPAFKSIGPVRKALAARGQRTIFNILGPLLNPGRPGHLLLGVFSEDWVARLARAAQTLGTSAGLAAHGRLGADKGIDELTSASDNRVHGIGRLEQVDGVWTPEQFGVRRRPFGDLVGGDLPANLELVTAILAGTAPPGLIDTLVFNSAVALWICGKTATVQEGLGTSRDLLLGGAVAQKLADVRHFYGDHPR